MKIEDYALIGDCHTAALVSKAGSIDWLCLPRFDSPACFAALLGTPEHGCWRIAPAGQVRSVRRKYREGTLILETDFETDDGAVRLIDCMPPRTTTPDVVRIIEGLRGRVPVHMELILRFDYGSIVPWVRRIPQGILAVAGPDTVTFQSDAELRGENLRTVSDFTVAAGQRFTSVMTWCSTYDPKPPEKNGERIVEESATWWQEWSNRCEYEGEWKDAVVRSLITLKGLTYAPTGGIVAAPTTSLPEALGGVRNWDYRYCWVRDATFTLYALMIGGYTEEADAWRKWLVNAVAGTPAAINILYGLSGERRLTEIELDWLPGYENSKPVRVGNASYVQHQLDVFGEVLDALYVGRRAGLKADENAWRVEEEFVNFLETDWKKPDNGIWEVRGPQRQFTHSKVMAWVAADRVIKAVEHFGMQGDAGKWRHLRSEIHDEICSKAFNPDVNSFVQYYGSREPDASLLMMPLVGFLPPEDPRISGTVEYIQKSLVRDGLVQRYHAHPEIDGLPPGEGTFLLCTFWLADNLFLLGRHAEAREIFERLLSLRNDVGLLSEQYDPRGRRFLGNFPQAFSHVGLINTARNLTSAGGPAEHRRRHHPLSEGGRSQTRTA